MRKFFLGFLLLLLAASCKKQSNSESTEVASDTLNLQVFEFKVSGMEDSLVADSLWKMIFTIEGIDQIILQKEDSLLVVRCSGQLSEEFLEAEIERRGASMIN